MRSLTTLFGKAFTLVEMLVVIAIIGILAGLLMPALAKARDQARQTSDMNNLSQIGKAVFMYAKDWGEHIPNAKNTWPNVKYLWPGHGSEDEYISEGENPKEHPESLMNLLKWYIQEPRTWVNPNAVCGLDDNGQITPNPGEMVQSYVVYGYNYPEKGYGRLAPPAPPTPPFFGSWPEGHPMFEFYRKNFASLDGRPPGVREGAMCFWVRNALGVTSTPATEKFKVPHQRGTSRPGYHILYPDATVRFTETHDMAATTPW